MGQQLEFFEIPSPCKGICQTDKKGLCFGCMRNREERFNWIKMDDAEKRAVLKRCHQRFIRRMREKLMGEDSNFQQEDDQLSLFEQ